MDGFLRTQEIFQPFKKYALNSLYEQDSPLVL